jgi:hypothetical protein
VGVYFDLSSLDDSDWESYDDEIEDMLLVVAVQKLHSEASRKRKRWGSTVGRLCIPSNRPMGSEMLM